MALNSCPDKLITLCAEGEGSTFMCASFKMKMHHELQLSILYLIMKFPFTLFSFKAIISFIYFFFF